MHCSMKQRLSVHSTPSSQSSLPQHSAQVPPQQRSVPPHLGALAHVPSTVHKSIVHASPSSQSSGPTQLFPWLGPAPLPLPLLPVPPRLVVPPESAPTNLLPPQALADRSGTAAAKNASSTNLGFKKLTTTLLAK
jgi:hypothetical protein